MSARNHSENDRVISGNQRILHSPNHNVPAEPDGEIRADAAPGARSGENALDSREAQANEQTYEGEDQEMEGGWIEDAAEDGTQ